MNTWSMNIWAINFPTLRFKLSAIRAGAIAIASVAAAFTLPMQMASAHTRAAIQRMVIEEAWNSRVPPSLALAVAKIESDFRAKAESHAGARGVMQIMPATGRSEFGVRPDELWNARLNIQLGIDFLEQLIDRYGGRWDLALSHYNGGSISGRGTKARPLAATRKYVAAVLAQEKRYAVQERVWYVAGDPESDGWKAARTHIALMKDANVGAADQVDQQQEATVGPREISDDFGDGFWNRFKKARDSLDDFGPHPRTRIAG